MEKRKGTNKDDEAVVGDNHGGRWHELSGAEFKGKSRGIGSGRVIHGSVKMR